LPELPTLSVAPCDALIIQDYPARRSLQLRRTIPVVCDYHTLITGNINGSISNIADKSAYFLTLEHIAFLERLIIMAVTNSAEHAFSTQRIQGSRIQEIKFKPSQM